LERETSRSRIGNVKDVNCAANLVRKVHHRLTDGCDLARVLWPAILGTGGIRIVVRSIGPEYTVARTVAERDVDRWALLQLAGSAIDRVHAQQVSAQIGTHNERAGWVEEDFVRVRCVLLWDGTRVAQVEVEFLDGAVIVAERKGKS
jgi:hypothetical protein